MAEIRLSKLTKQFSIGLARLVDFLNEQGANVEMNPNAKVSDEYLPAIEAKFGEDQKLKADAEKVTIKLKEIIEMGPKKKSSQEEEEDVPEKEVVIKSTTLTEPAPEVKPEPVAEQPKVEVPAEEPKEEGGIKIVDKIDLTQFDKRKPAPAEETKPVEEPVAAEEPKEEAPVAEPEPVEVEPEPVVEAEPREVKVEVERLAGPKVVDKIDLSQFDKKKKKKRERIDKGGSQKVDVTKVEADNKVNRKDNKHKGGNAPQQAQQAQGKNGKKNSWEYVTALVRGAEQMQPTDGGMLDLFGNDDAFRESSEKLARYVAAVREGLKARLNVLMSAGRLNKKGDVSKELGVKVKTPKDATRLIERMANLDAAYERLDPDLGIPAKAEAWDGKSREELAQVLCDMIESAPREAAVNWLHTFLLPMLEQKAKEGGMRESA